MASAAETDEETERKNRYSVTPNRLGKAIGSQIGILASLNGTLGSNSPSSKPQRSKNNDMSASSPSSAASQRGSIFVNRHGVHYSSSFSYADDNRKDKADPKRLEEEWARDWRHLAEVVDRLFFWLFLSAIVITTLLLFHPLTKAYFSLLGDETILRGTGQTKSAEAQIT